MHAPALRHEAFLAKTEFFQHVGRRVVARVDVGLDPVDADLVEAVTEHGFDRFAGIAIAPVAAGDGVAQFAAVVLVIEVVQGDGADHFAAARQLDGKAQLGLVAVRFKSARDGGVGHRDIGPRLGAPVAHNGGVGKNGIQGPCIGGGQRAQHQALGGQYRGAISRHGFALS